MHERYSGEASYFQKHLPVEEEKSDRSEEPETAATTEGPIQQMSWMPDLGDTASHWNVMKGGDEGDRRSRRKRRPWRSPVARRSGGGDSRI